ncbi:MAG: 2-dehydropantoate 2-reductase [Methylococcaceae bacterium]|nr:2-dehydropantoate 2-reductase [Methylococcaceae bacterium]
MKQDKILIIGAGAIGSFYGAILSKAGAEVSVVCRSNYQAVKKKGFAINSNDLGDWIFKPSQVIQSAAEYAGTADYIILCTKVIPAINRIELLQAAVSPETCIVFIQNGVEIEQELVDAFPNNEVISGLAFICCNRIAPGITHHLAYGKLTLGSLNKTAITSNRAQHLANLINQTGIESVVTDQIISNRWLKCLWNASFNPLSVLSGGLSTAEILSTQEPLIRTIMQEVMQIAEACGYTLAEDSIDTNINNTYTMPPYKTSMLLDYENHKTMEVEAILGNTLIAAKRQQVDSPVIDTLYALMKLQQLKFNI